MSKYDLTLIESISKEMLVAFSEIYQLFEMCEESINRKFEESEFQIFEDYIAQNMVMLQSFTESRIQTLSKSMIFRLRKWHMENDKQNDEKTDNNIE